MKQLNNETMKTTKQFLMVLVFVATTFSGYAQVGIGTTSPDTSTILDVVSTNQAILIPRVSDRAAILSPPEGLIIYNTTSNDLEFSNGTQWVDIKGVAITAITGGAATTTGGVLIAATGTDPHNTAILELRGTKALLLPRHNAAPTAVPGMMYYNSTTNKFQVARGTGWGDF